MAVTMMFLWVYKLPRHAAGGSRLLTDHQFMLWLILWGSRREGFSLAALDLGPWPLEASRYHWWLP